MAACATSLDTGEEIQLVCGNPLGCPGNSDIVAALGPYELSLAPIERRPANTRGFKIESIKHNGVPFSSFDVVGASLVGTLPGDDTKLSRGLLIGTTIRLHHTSGRVFDMQLEQYFPVPFYDTTRSIEIIGYLITYQEVGVAGNGPQDLCPYKEPELDPNSNRTWAVFWKGDRYRPSTAEIFASGPGAETEGHVGDWFNLSCAGEATIKMLRNEVGEAVAPRSPVAARKATLNMFTAKYCPDPTRYTQLGQPLSWQDTWTSNGLGDIESFEAIWDQNGAVCLNTPRLAKRENVQCDIPRCTIRQRLFFDTYGDLKSGNPPPPPPEDDGP
jgi:hypothetical protein